MVQTKAQEVAVVRSRFLMIMSSIIGQFQALHFATQKHPEALPLHVRQGSQTMKELAADLDKQLREHLGWCGPEYELKQYERRVKRRECAKRKANERNQRYLAVGYGGIPETRKTGGKDKAAGDSEQDTGPDKQLR
jgi:hypothetical protein